MEKLDQEKFNSVKELSEIQLKISEGKALLFDIENKKNEYLKLREIEGNERVAKILEESKEALREVGKNQDELVSYKNQLTDFAKDLYKFSEGLQTIFNDFTVKVEKANLDMDSHRKVINEEMQKMKIERVNIVEDRKQVERERAEVMDQLRLLQDKREAFDRAFAEVERNKNKKQ